eukprot:365967-Chlamydomonas_euryale.AAC.5
MTAAARTIGAGEHGWDERAHAAAVAAAVAFVVATAVSPGFGVVVATAYALVPGAAVVFHVVAAAATIAFAVAAKAAAIPHAEADRTPAAAPPTSVSVVAAVVAVPRRALRHPIPRFARPLVCVLGLQHAESQSTASTATAQRPPANARGTEPRVM